MEAERKEIKQHKPLAPAELSISLGHVSVSLGHVSARH